MGSVLVNISPSNIFSTMLLPKLSGCFWTLRALMFSQAVDEGRSADDKGLRELVAGCAQDGHLHEKFYTWQEGRPAHD